MRQGDASIGGWINLANKQDVRYIGCIQKDLLRAQWPSAWRATLRSGGSRFEPQGCQNLVLVFSRFFPHHTAWYGSLSTYYIILDPSLTRPMLGSVPVLLGMGGWKVMLYSFTPDSLGLSFKSPSRLRFKSPVISNICSVWADQVLLTVPPVSLQPSIPISSSTVRQIRNLIIQLNNGIGRSVIIIDARQVVTIKV